MISLRSRCAALVLLLTGVLQLASAAPVETIDVRSYPTLQAAIDANPGRILQLPPGDYTIDQALKITHDRTELWGPARIVQTNAKEAIVRIENAKGIRLTELAFTRSEGAQEAERGGVEVTDCEDVELSHLRVSENHSHSSIVGRRSKDISVHDCTVTNYKGPAIDDRMRDLVLGGYAFNSIDGTGIQMLAVEGCVIRDNRVQELRLWPTKEVRDRYDLGKVIRLVPERPRRMSQSIWDTKYTNNWHQGAGIQVSAPETAARVIITGNYIDHAAQGLDVHADNVIVSSNFISYAMIGMKAMHGAKHILIDGNQFEYCDLWGVYLQPGAASHTSANADGTTKARAENVDGGSVISNNIFSHFGWGDQWWNWEANKNSKTQRNVICLFGGQLEENPPLHNVLVTGNVVYDSGQDTLLIDGKWTKAPPRYHYAFYVEQTKQPVPVNVHAYGNLFDAGSEGVSNFPEAAASASVAPTAK